VKPRAKCVLKARESNKNPRKRGAKRAWQASWLLEIADPAMQIS
jgi:hypothetical protein